MAQLDGVGPVDGPRKILGESLRRMANVSQTPENPVDQVEISAEARDMAALSQIPDIRYERVQQVRQEIANGTYETDQKWDLAIRRMMRDIFGEGQSQQ